MKKGNQTSKVYTSISLILSHGELGDNQLYLGDAQAAKDHQILTHKNIRTIISIGQEAAPTKRFAEIKYYKLNLRDQVNENMLTHLQKIIFLIDQARPKGNVFIHCYHGVSRSASFVIGYLMKKQIISFEKAKQRVKQKRRCICPNKGFANQLAQYQTQCLTTKKQKIDSF